MTTAIHIATTDPALPDPSQSRLDRVSARVPVSARWMAAVGTMLGGGGLLSLGYRLAVHNLAHGRFVIWAGLLLITVAFLSAATEHDLKPSHALVICCLLGGILYLAKLGREPSAFVYTDELQHVRSTSEILGGARLFVRNPINPVLAHYPGLHVATAAISRATGLSAFVAGNIVIAAAKVLLAGSLFAVYRRLLGSPRLAAIGVLVYAANPAFMYFDAQFSYESLALPFAVTVLALLMREADDRIWPVAVNGFTALLVAATIFTHHITGIILGPLLVLFGIASWGRLGARKRRAWRLMLWGLGTSAGMVAWIVFVAPDTWGYLAPSIQNTLQTIPHFLSGQLHARTPFAKSPIVTPRYEQLAGLASVLLDFGFVLLGAFVARRWKGRRGPLVACLLLGLLYFGSLPLQLLQGATAAPIAPRVWETSFLGLAPLAAVGIAWLTARRSLMAVLGAGAAAFLMVMGGATIRSGPNIRLPGPYLPSSGPLAATPDALRAASWLLNNYGPERRVMADTTLADVFGAYALATPETYQNFGIKPWRVFITATLTPAGEFELSRSGTQFVVVDRRVSRYPPFGGFYFSPQEPREPYRVIPLRDITKFATALGFTEIYDSGNIAIYRYEAPFGGPRPTASATLQRHEG